MNYNQDHKLAEWNYATRSYDDSGCWEDYLSSDEYEDALDRRRFEQSNPYGV